MVDSLKKIPLWQDMCKCHTNMRPKLAAGTLHGHIENHVTDNAPEIGECSPTWDQTLQKESASMSMFLIGLITGLSAGACLGVLILGLLVAMRSEGKMKVWDSTALAGSSFARHRAEAPLAIHPQRIGIVASRRTQFQSTDKLPVEIPYLPLRMANTPAASPIMFTLADTPHGNGKRLPAG